MTETDRPDLAYRRVFALTAALFLSYLTVAMSLPAVPVHVVQGLGFDNAYGGLAEGGAESAFSRSDVRFRVRCQ